MDTTHIPNDDQLGQLLQRATEIQSRIEEATTARAEGKAISDSVAELRVELTAVKGQIDAWQTAENERTAASDLAKLKTDVQTLLSSTRTPSKAAAISHGTVTFQGEETFFATLALASSRDWETQQAAKARLAAMGAVYAMPDPAAKATVGDSDAAGGYIVPNAVVADINLQATAIRSVVDLFTTIPGVRGSTVDIPWEDEAVSRAVIAAAGATKENSNFTVNNYTATLYTLARIFDVGNQLLRHSAGAAEQLVRSKLARAFGLGEDYYALQGTGSSQPYGLLTALGTSGTYVTSHTAATTQAGSIATAIAKAAGAVANRGAIPDGVVMNSGNYWTMLAQGSDDAGFFIAPSAGPLGVNAQAVGVTAAGPFGIRLRHSPNMPSDSLVVGEFSAAQFYRGLGYRVDVSSEAGTRWDTNLTGFRGEEEIAFDARPTVYTGRFQRIVDVVP